jgi:hypothetical protein
MALIVDGKESWQDWFLFCSSKSRVEPEEITLSLYFVILKGLFRTMTAL